MIEDTNDEKENDEDEEDNDENGGGDDDDDCTCSMGKCQSLAHLDLRQNHLTELPWTVWSIRTLTHVYLSKNTSLKKASMSIEIDTTMRHEDHGQLRTHEHHDPHEPPTMPLPHEPHHHHHHRYPLWAHLPHLTYLDMSYCAIQDASLPSRAYHTSMERHVSEANALTRSATSITTLQPRRTNTEEDIQVHPYRVTHLDLSQNQLTDLPRGIEDLDSLLSFKMSHNALGGTLPSQILNCHALTHLFLDHNRLTALPPGLATLRGRAQHENRMHESKIEDGAMS
jgi:hypothetical protein